MKRSESGLPGDVYFEFYALGGTVKVTALCAVTGVEAVVIGPIHASQSDMQKLALAKLKRALEKSRNAP